MKKTIKELPKIIYSYVRPNDIEYVRTNKSMYLMDNKQGPVLDLNLYKNKYNSDYLVRNIVFNPDRIISPWHIKSIIM